MSIKVMAKVWDGYPNGGGELLTLLALADWSDDIGYCYPSISALAKKIRLSEKQARRLVHELINENFVKVVANLHGGAPGSTRRYQINIAALTPPIDVTPRGETAPMGVPDGSHQCPLTPPMDGSLTIIEPSLTTNTKFAQFWAAYPKKKSKGDAEKAFRKINPDGHTFCSMLKAIEIQSQTEQWQKDKGQYIPYPATWLRDQSWLDDVDADSDDLMAGVT